MRDIELCRTILLAASGQNRNGPIAGYADDAVKYNKRLLIDKGYLKGRVVKRMDADSEIPLAVHVSEITWEGHDFIDAIRDEANWARVKTFLAEAGKQVTVDTIDVAVQRLFRFGAAA